MSDLRALLLTDVVDSTKLSLRIGDEETARLWARHDRAARDLLPAWRGREIDKTDGMLLLFETASDAVGYALAYQQALNTLEPPVKARAGLHVGPVTLRENSSSDVMRGAKPLEVEGGAKSIAARVMSVAMGGQILLSARARQSLHDDGLCIQSHGHWHLKGVDEPIELFEVGDAQAPFVPPPDADKAYRVVRQGQLWLPVREIRHSLPAERDSFTGRQDALRVLAQKLEGGARLISILGMGGNGKTRLATHFAWGWLGDYPGGIWFCDLAQARSLDGILFAVAQGLEARLGGSDPVAQLASAIAGRGKCLVILDNFEQVTRFAEATVGSWLDRAPLAKFIVTTREVLGIVGEHTLALEALSVPDSATLFMSRAESAMHGYHAGADDQAAIRQLVAVLDGLPLAIELAAARVRLMPPRTMLARMHERFSVLMSKGRRERQATLRATFDWSWELLSIPEKAALAQLSVFRGGFTLASAEGVLALEGSRETVPHSADIVHWLVDKSLVRQVSQDRFDLLESLREYAAEHLRTEGRYPGSGPDAQTAAEARHGNFFASLGHRAVEAAGTVEVDNLVAACSRAVERGDGSVAARALAGAWILLQMRGPLRVAVELARAASAVAGVEGAARVEVDLVLGSALRLCGSVAEGRRHIEAAVAQAAGMADRMLLARGQRALGVLLAQSGEFEAAQALYLPALATFREFDERARECGVLAHLGELCDAMGRHDDAGNYYETGLRVATEFRLRRWEGAAAGNLGQFHANQGRQDAARPLYALAIEIAHELGDQHWEANARCNLGLLHHATGQLAEAQTELEASLAAARELGHARLVSIVQCNLGLVAEARGRPDEAVARHQAALDLARDLGDRRSQGQFLTYLGVLHGRQSRFDAARECLATGAALFTALGDRVNMGILLCNRAEIEHLAGNTEQAEAALAQANGLVSELQDVQPASELGQALRRVGDMLKVVA
jgi:predicted ATPase/class 3 adenylate cyclase